MVSRIYKPGVNHPLPTFNVFFVYLVYLLLIMLGSLHSDLDYGAPPVGANDLIPLVVVLFLTVLLLRAILTKSSGIDPRFSAVPTFVVNLDKRPDRFAFVLSELKRAGIVDPSRWVGYDGESLPANVLDRIRVGLQNVRFSNAQAVESRLAVHGRGMVGCYLSHIELHEYLVKRGSPVVLVTEDDLKIRERVVGSISTAHVFDEVYKRILKLEWDMFCFHLSKFIRAKTISQSKLVQKFRVGDQEFKIYEAYASDGEIYGNYMMLVKPVVSNVFLYGSREGKSNVLDPALPLTQACDSRYSSFATGHRKSVLADEIQDIPKCLRMYFIDPPLVDVKYEDEQTSDTSFA